MSSIGFDELRKCWVAHVHGVDADGRPISEKVTGATREDVERAAKDARSRLKARCR